tara:strand:- start:436 stop:819 length:384 start_codon:yes stop_codon:yes gene_type:complete
MKKEHIYVGIAIIIVVIAILLINNNKQEVVEEVEEIIIPTGCENIDLEIVEANAARKILKVKRGVGEGELDKLQVKIGDDVSQVNAQNVVEGKEQVFIIGISSGDVVEISAILKDRTVCPVADTVIA